MSMQGKVSLLQRALKVAQKRAEKRKLEALTRILQLALKDPDELLSLAYREHPSGPALIAGNVTIKLPEPLKDAAKELVRAIRREALKEDRFFVKTSKNRATIHPERR